MNREFFIHNAWRKLAGLPELSSNALTRLALTEWSSRFEQLMRNRLIVGAFRYGRFRDKNKPTYDRVAAIIKRAHHYQETGNDELLVDIANLAMLEFEEGIHSLKHFKSEDDGEHVESLPEF